MSFIAGQCGDVLSEALEECICSMRTGEQCEVVIEPQTALDECLSAKAIPAGSSIRYSIELVSFDRGKCPWEMNNAERVEAANHMKTAGSEKFRSGNIRAAAVLYSRALKLVIPISPTEVTDAVVILKCALLLNLAACQLKLGRHGNAGENCTEVLKLQPGNVKALYRRALALTNCKDFDGARRDFARARQLEPNNRTVEEQMQVMEAKAQEHNSRLKEALKSMFGGPPN